jgi:hypothetical protein
MPTSTETKPTSGIRVKSILPMTLFVLLQCGLIGSGLYISTTAIQAEGVTIDSLKVQNNILRTDRDAERYADSILFGDIKNRIPTIIYDTITREVYPTSTDSSKPDARDAEIAHLKEQVSGLGAALALCQERFPTRERIISRSVWDSVVRLKKARESGGVVR